MRNVTSNIGVKIRSDMRGLIVKFIWYKRCKNNFFHKIISFIFPVFSPSLQSMIKQEKINNAIIDGMKKGMFDKYENK